MNISKPTMLIYSYAPKEILSHPQVCKNAHEYLRHLWDACARLGMKDQLDRLKFPVDFPTELNLTDPQFRVRAALIDGERLKSNSYYQAFLFEYQEIFGLIVALETNDEEGEWSCWQGLYNEWRACIEDKPLPEGLMGEAYVFSGAYADQMLSPADSNAFEDHLIGETTVQIGESARDALPASMNGAREATDLYLTDSRFCLWEGESLEGRRIIALIAPQAKTDAVFQWAVWVNQNQLAPFACYLMHAFKLRFAQHVFEREISSLRRRRQAIDPAFKDLLELHERIENNKRIRTDELIKEQDGLSRAQVDTYGLLYSLSRLRELRLTAQIAKANLQRLIPRHHHALAPPTNSMFDDDLGRAGWLQEQISIDLEYLDALVTRAKEGHQMIALRLEQEAQKNARQLNSLILLQGTLLGALIVGLAAIQAVHPLLAGNALGWPLIGLLAALALALPPLFAHWHEPYRMVDRFVGGTLGASLVWFSTTFWIVLKLPTYKVSYLIWSLYQVFTPALGFLIGYQAVKWLDRLQGITRKPEKKFTAKNQ